MTFPLPSPPSSFKKVLVFSQGELIGDGMIKLPFIRALSSCFPNAEVTWLTNKRSSTIFQTALYPLVQNYLHHIIEFQGFGESLTQLWSKPWRNFLNSNSGHFEKFDLILDTEKKALLALHLKQIPHNLFISAAYGWSFSDRKPKPTPNNSSYNSPLLLDRLLSLLEVSTEKTLTPDLKDKLYDTSIPQAWLDQARQLLNPNLTANKKIILLAPGAGGRFKCWPLAKFVALAKVLEEAGLQPAFVLGPAEQEWYETLRPLFPQGMFPLFGIPSPSPYLTMALARLADVNVANDGGVGHILAAANQPLLSLWGPTDPKKSTPNGRQVTILKAQDFGGKSMEDIPLTAVLRSIRSLL